MRAILAISLLLIAFASLAAPVGRDSRPAWASDPAVLMLANGKQWEQMSPQEREAIRRQKEIYDALPRSEQERIREARERYESMPKDERQQLRKRWEQLPAEEKKRYKIKEKSKK